MNKIEYISRKMMDRIEDQLKLRIHRAKTTIQKQYNDLLSRLAEIDEVVDRQQAQIDILNSHINQLFQGARGGDYRPPVDHL